MAQPQTASIVDKDEKLVIITGFGTFSGHESVNASWEAVKLLPDMIFLNDTIYRIEKQLIEVEYCVVDKAVKAIWDRNPELVIHCGVDATTSRIHLEKFAYNKFTKGDNVGFCPINGKACLLRPDCKTETYVDILKCGLDLDKVVQTLAIKLDDKSVLPRVNEEIGTFVCCYTYLQSLYRNSNRSLFIHVPPINKPLSSEQAAFVIYNVAEQCLRQIADCNCLIENSN